MKKLLMLFLAFIFVTANVFSDEHPIINTSEVEKVVLEMFYDVGRFSGYIIFYDKDANQCAVKGKGSASLKRGWDFEKKLDIKPSKFETFHRGDIEIYGYKIDCFLLEVTRTRRLTFSFEWDDLKARDKIYVKRYE